MKVIRKIAVITPVLLVSGAFLWVRYFQQYQHTTPKRLVVLIATILLFYIWTAAGVIRRKQHSFFDILLQASFYVYLFSVLTLTGYFIFFNQSPSHDWWHKMVQRVNTRDGVNLQPFMFMKGHHLPNYEVVGNSIMLLPLGIYLPLLYSKIKNFFTVTFVAMLVSVSIELMQLATNYRITDIDDVILNTTGASAGFIIYIILYALIIKPLHLSSDSRILFRQ